MWDFKTKNQQLAKQSISLLKKYIAHIVECEGRDYISNCNDNDISDIKFSDEEIKSLESLSEFNLHMKGLDISKGQPYLSYKCNCSKPYIISKPLYRVEERSIFRTRWFSVDCWLCLNCKWESEEIRTRI